MVYQVSRDESEDLGHVFHAFVGARMVAEVAAAKANEAAAEYQQKLLALMAKIGIPQDMVQRVKVQWHSGTVTIEDPLTTPVQPTSDGNRVPA